MRPPLRQRAKFVRASLRNISSLAAWLVLSSCAAHAEPVARASQQGNSGKLALTYLGTAGWALSAGAHQLLLDPYFTRDPVVDRARPLLPNADAIARYAPARAEFILVGHSHYDHLLDVPSIAQRTQATIVGSPSTLRVARAAGIPEARLKLAAPGNLLRLGLFEVLPLASLHSATGESFTTIAEDVRLPLAAQDYAEGTTLSYLVHVEGHSIVFIDSANFVEASLSGLRPDVAVVATALRERVPDYTCRLVKVLGQPRLILPNHFDAHWEPLVARENRLDPEQRADLTRFAAEVRACSPHSAVVVPEAFRAIEW